MPWPVSATPHFLLALTSDAPLHIPRRQVGLRLFLPPRPHPHPSPLHAHRSSSHIPVFLLFTVCWVVSLVAHEQEPSSDRTSPHLTLHPITHHGRRREGVRRRPGPEHHVQRQTLRLQPLARCRAPPRVGHRQARRAQAQAAVAAHSDDRYVALASTTPSSHH